MLQRQHGGPGWLGMGIVGGRCTRLGFWIILWNTGLKVQKGAGPGSASKWPQSQDEPDCLPAPLRIAACVVMGPRIFICWQGGRRGFACE